MSDIFSILVICFHIYIILTIIFLLLDNRATSTTFAWIFVFIVFPVFGQILYFLIGRNWRHPDKKKRLKGQRIKQDIIDILEPLVSRQDQNKKNVEMQPGSFSKKKLLELLHKNSNAILTTRNIIQVQQSGAEKFEFLLNDISRAKHFIHMEYFIWRSDSLTEEFKELLIKKAREGVEVRILYDALGSLFLKYSYIKQLRNAGVAIYPYYNFVSPFTVHTLNYRNHRKIVVIDGQVGYTGGMNMGREYVDGGKRFSSWRDTHVRLEGEAVLVLQSIFLTSWLNTTKEDLLKDRYFPEINDFEDYLPIQITTSGPDSQWESIQQLYFTLITSAEKSVYIQSPYFVPDNSIFIALKTAALSGLDVRLMMSGKPDKYLPFWSAYTYFHDLLKAGVKIYQYQKGFLHSKTIAVDGEICSIGTANMDMRSFHLNYEIGILFYDTVMTQRLVNDFNTDLENCSEITIEIYRGLGALKRFRNSASRLFAPIL